MRRRLTSYMETVSDVVGTMVEVTSFFLYPFCAAVFYSVGNKVAQTEEFDCGNFFKAITDESCGDLKRIVILDSATVFSEGSVFSTYMAMSVMMGIVVASGFWLVRHRRRENQYDFLENEDLPMVSIAPRSYLSDGDEVIPPPVPALRRWQAESWTQKIKDISNHAFLVGKFAALLSLPFGISLMTKVGNRILQDFGCEHSLLEVTLPFSAKRCDPLAVYYAMTAFTFPWALVTWSSYSAYFFSVLYQLAPEKIKQGLSAPFSSLYQHLPCLPLRISEEKKLLLTDLKSHVELSIKTIGLIASYGLIYPVLSKAIHFADEVLDAYGCPDFLTTLLQNKFFDDPNSECMPLMQVLGVDAFPASSEVFSAYFWIACVVASGSAWGFLQNLVVRYLIEDLPALRGKMKSYHAAIDEVLQTGKRSALLSMPIAVYGFISIAVPKANSMLTIDGCNNKHYPWAASYSSDQCDIMTSYRANATFFSLLWILSTYPSIFSAWLGMGSHIIIKNSSKARHMFSRIATSIKQCLWDDGENEDFYEQDSQLPSELSMSS